MQKLAVSLVLGIAITAIAMFGADRQVGTWQYNAARSTSTSANPITERTEVYEEMPDGGIKITRTEQRADGIPLTYSYSFKYDGKEYSLPNGPYDRISVKRIDANTTSFETRKVGTSYRTKARIVVSKDGKSKIQSSEGTDAKGNKMMVTYLFDKQ